MTATRSGGARIRVLTLLDSVSRLGGAETVALRLARGLDPDRFESWLCASRWSEGERSLPQVATLLSSLEKRGSHFLGLERDSKVSIGAWRPLRELLRRERIDVVHSHLFGSNVWAAVIAPGAGVPVVVAHDHNWSFEGGAGRRLIDRFLIARRAATYLTVSTESRRRMIELEKLPPAKVRVMPNGVPATDPPSRAEARALLGIDDDRPVVGTVAVLRPEKALDVLVDAAPRVRERIGEAEFLIAGEGPERSRLEARISALGLGRSVRLLGARDDVATVLAACDLAVCCSDWEGAPLSVIEYMQAGLATVATDVGGLPELLGEGAGTFVPPRNPGALAAAIAELLEDPQRRLNLGEHAAARQRAELSLDAMLGRVEALYAELVAGRADHR